MSLIHVYACCPSALLSGKITHYFGPKWGRFLDPFPYMNPNINKPTWSKCKLTPSEELKLKEILYKLKLDGSIQRTLPSHSYIKNDNFKPEMLISELNKKKTNLTLAIVEGGSDICSNSKSIYKVSDFQKENKFTLGTEKLYMSPEAFFNAVPNFIIKSSKRFKLIDPYFFDLTNSFINVPNRLKFIDQLIRKFYSFEENKNCPINIDIYGKSSTDYSKNVKTNFAKHINELPENLPFIINFFLLKDKKNTEDIPEDIKKHTNNKIHERFFCCGKYNFKFEDSIMDRSGEGKTQSWDFLPKNNKLNEFIDCFEENTKVYDLTAQFDSKQLEILGKY